MRFLVAVGVAAVVIGFVAAVDRGLAAALDPSTTVVTLIGLFGVVQGIRYANGRRHRERRAADPGEPERRARASVPGADLDERIARMTATTRGGYRSRRELRERVRAVAAASVARDRNCSTTEAERTIEAGRWTDNSAAAAFLSKEVSYPVRVQLRAAVSGRSRYGFGLPAAIDAIDRLEAGEVGADGVGGSDADRESVAEAKR